MTLIEYRDRVLCVRDPASSQRCTYYYFFIVWQAICKAIEHIAVQLLVGLENRAWPIFWSRLSSGNVHVDDLVPQRRTIPNPSRRNSAGYYQ